jgi:hypothetical protein
MKLKNYKELFEKYEDTDYDDESYEKMVFADAAGHIWEIYYEVADENL